MDGGETVKEARLAKADLELGLAGKLLEEVEEFLRAPSQGEKTAEVADILEVVKGMAAASGLSWSQIEKLAKEKSSKRGGFKDGRVLLETTLPHRDSPIERQEQVRIGDLGVVESTEELAEIAVLLLQPMALRSYFPLKKTQRGFGCLLRMVEFKSRVWIRRYRNGAVINRSCSETSIIVLALWQIRVM